MPKFIIVNKSLGNTKHESQIFMVPNNMHVELAQPIY